MPDPRLSPRTGSEDWPCGHPRDDANTYQCGANRYRCRECHRTDQRERSKPYYRGLSDERKAANYANQRRRTIADLIVRAELRVEWLRREAEWLGVTS